MAPDTLLVPVEIFMTEPIVTTVPTLLVLTETFPSLPTSVELGMFAGSYRSDSMVPLVIISAKVISRPIPSTEKFLLFFEMDMDVDSGSCPTVRNSPGERYFVASFGIHVSADVSDPQVIACNNIPNDGMVLIGMD
jgi:hypothetical protein